MSRGFLELRGQGPAVLAPCPAGLHTGAGVGRRDYGRRQWSGGATAGLFVCQPHSDLGLFEHSDHLADCRARDAPLAGETEW